MEGKAEERIIEYADSKEIQLLILSSHGRSGLTGWNVSSVVQKIILRAYTSTLIVRAYQPVLASETGFRYSRLFVPLDGSQRAESVLPIASNLATYYDAELLLGHVVPRPEMPRRTPLTPEDSGLSERITERNRVEATRYLEDLQSRLPEKTQVRLLVSDRLTASLHDMARDEQADLVLLTAHGYSGESKWPYGSVVISFIAYGTTPLLIFQDIPKNLLRETEAEVVAREFGKR
jgi:nucleotide-binding universal stress UspA family protein